MAFHVCDPTTTNCDDPHNHQVYVAQSADGVNWAPITGYTSARGSVPDLVRRDGTIYIYSPGSGGQRAGNVRRYRIDTGVILRR
jgi:hypothetical protein